MMVPMVLSSSARRLESINCDSSCILLLLLCMLHIHTHKETGVDNDRKALPNELMVAPRMHARLCLGITAAATLDVNYE